MFICVCNGLNERTVENAIRSGARTVSGVYRECACLAQCGRCAASIREKLGQVRCGREPAGASAG